MKNNIFNEFTTMHDMVNEAWRYASGEAESENMRRSAKRQMRAERKEGFEYHLIIQTVGDSGEGESVTIVSPTVNEAFDAALLPFPDAMFHGYDDRVDVVVAGKVVAVIVERGVNQ